MEGLETPLIEKSLRPDASKGLQQGVLVIVVGREGLAHGGDLHRTLFTSLPASGSMSPDHIRLNRFFTSFVYRPESRDDGI